MHFLSFLGNVILVTVIVVFLRFVLTAIFSRKPWREVVMTHGVLDHRNVYVTQMMNSAGVLTTLALLYEGVNIFLVIVASLCAIYFVQFVADLVLSLLHK
jgi:branched-subunit amino acid transport protein